MSLQDDVNEAKSFETKQVGWFQANKKALAIGFGVAIAFAVALKGLGVI